MEEFVARPSRGRLAFLLLVCLLFMGIALWMVGLFGEPPASRRYSPAFVTFLGWSCLLFIGLCAAMIAKRMTDSRDQLRIGADGIQSTPWSDQVIPWEEIAEIGVWSHRGQQSIILGLHHPERFPGRGLAAKLAAANRAMTGGDVAISLTGTDRSFDEAWDAIAHYRR